MRTRNYTCKECGNLIEGASYDHSPECSQFPDPLEFLEFMAMPASELEVEALNESAREDYS